MQIHEKIKALRVEKDLSQKELGELIDGDARQISLYETQKVYPSSEAIAKLATALKVSADYLLFDEAQRRPLMLEVDDAFDKIEKINLLEEEDKKALFRLIDSLSLKSQIQTLAKQK